VDGIEPLPPEFLDWLDYVQERLVRLESGRLEFPTVPSRGIASHLWRLRQECQRLHGTLGVLVDSGQIRSAIRPRMEKLLGDLSWLLEVSPWASPVLARQCIRIARDRIQDEAQEFPDVPSKAAIHRIHSCAA